jgi:hypothetical protein
MNVTIKLNGYDREAELDVEASCLVLHVEAAPPFRIPIEVTIDRREVRAALNTLGYDADRNMWWDGYNEALADAERAIAAGKGDALLEWVNDVRQKFGLQLEQ